MKKLLIANRSEIARRIIRTAHAMGIDTVAVYSDADAQALHVREATQTVALHGNASADTYLRIDKLLAAARQTGADAIHPGYGFLSENADFAQAVINAGLIWVGPPPHAIRALGSKSAAKALALSCGVPCLPGYHGPDQSDERLLQEAHRIGLPIMVKAAAGGGGRGMRLVTDMAQLKAAVHSARSEAEAAFGDGELLLERALSNPRHVEVQVFADAHGHCIHLGERDCSVQRRHQKIIEETPSPAVSDAVRERITRCAVELAHSAGYVGAGTVEFLLEGDDFCLMEMNTRLQVEHCVTEMVTGLDLVEWQIRVARGEPLPLTQDQVQFKGHAIEVRLCAEDENFTPYCGTVHHFKEPQDLLPLPHVKAKPSASRAGAGRSEGSRVVQAAPCGAPSPQSSFRGEREKNPATPACPTLRFDHALYEGQHIAPHYDSLLGKLIAHAATRDQAITHLARALDETEILGLPTNRALLAACLRHDVFQSGQALIPFLQIHGEGLRQLLLKKELLEQQTYGLQAVLSVNFLSLWGRVGVGTRALPCRFPRPIRLRHRGQLFDIEVPHTPTPQPGTIVIQTDHHRWHIQRCGTDLFIEDASFDPPETSQAASAANELRAPFNGKVVAVKTLPGAAVQKGDVLVIVESMKLEHSLAATRAGIVKSVAVQPGQQVAPGQILVSLEPL